MFDRCFRLLAIGSVASVAIIALALLIDWSPPQASTRAEDVDVLYDVLLIVSAPIFVVP